MTTEDFKQEILNNSNSQVILSIIGMERDCHYFGSGVGKCLSKTSIDWANYMAKTNVPLREAINGWHLNLINEYLKLIEQYGYKLDTIDYIGNGIVGVYLTI